MYPWSELVMVNTIPFTKKGGYYFFPFWWKSVLGHFWRWLFSLAYIYAQR